ncbi:MAG: hypothetical protein ACLFRG_04810 [Desulfococcaceae bacterium]
MESRLRVRADGLRVYEMAKWLASFSSAGRHPMGDIKRPEARVRRHERLAAPGRMTASVAHEIRNLLGACLKIRTPAFGPSNKF